MMETDKELPPRVLVVAGSDSGGGAGIQADIKAITMLGSFAMTAVTAITAQDTKGVHGIWPLPVDAVVKQMRVTLQDIGADVIKMGMLGSSSLVEAVAEEMSNTAKGVACIVDPVMVATSGDRLLDEKAIDALRAMLVPGARLVTPNAPEAEILTGKAVETVDGQRRAAEALLEMGAHGALIKGGHIDTGTITDVLQTTTGEWLFEGARINTLSTHGTGCTLASATAALLAQNESLPRAVERAREYLRGALVHAEKLGHGHGPVKHNWLLNTSEQ